MTLSFDIGFGKEHGLLGVIHILSLVEKLIKQELIQGLTK